MVGPEDQSVGPVTAFVPVDELVPVLAERRGKYTLTVMEGRGNLGHCLTNEDEGASSGMARAVDSTLRPDVTEVTIHPPGQVPVQATVERGYWTAWWPFELISTKMPTPIGTTAELALTDGSTVEDNDIPSIANFDYNYWPKPLLNDTLADHGEVGWRHPG